MKKNQKISTQIAKFPSTRYMGSKNKLLPQLQDVFSKFDFSTAIDLFAGSGIVGYLLKAEGKKVISNDYMALSSVWTKSLIENKSTTLSEEDIQLLITPNGATDEFVQKHYKDIYFTDKDSFTIDTIRNNAKKLKEKHKKELALSALCRACCKKRPRGIFTYTGFRYDDGRKDLNKTIKEHFIEAAQTFNNAVFDNGQENVSLRKNAFEISAKADLVYIDPPYYSLRSDNEYVRRYHFVEGIACDWKDVEMQWNTKTKKFKNYPTPFSSKKGTHKAFDAVFHTHKDKILVVSYSSNCLPTLKDMVEMISKYKSNVEVITVDYKYSFGNHGHKVGDNKNTAKEYIFIGT